MDQAFCIMSGGLDSTLAAYWAKGEYKNVSAIFFKWGQKAVKEEEKAVKYICGRINIKPEDIEIIEIPISKWDPSDLTGDDSNVIHDPKNIMVPERNLIFIALAASYARTEGGGDLVVGFNKDDLGYDTNLDFVKAMNAIFAISNGGMTRIVNLKMKNSLVKVVAPLMDKDKPYIVKKLQDLELLEKTYSCYAANGPCDNCPACYNRNVAIRDQ